MYGWVKIWKNHRRGYQDSLLKMGSGVFHIGGGGGGGGGRGGGGGGGKHWF